MKRKYFRIFISLMILAFIFLFSTISFAPKKNLSLKNKMLVHYIDVGQGDSMLIQVNGKNLLIDSGPKESKSKILSYLDSISISKLDYIVSTHPHEDHIGNMSAIIDKYKLGSFFAPKVEYTTSSFEKMIESLVRKNLKINVIKADSNTIDLGEGTKVTVFSPFNETYSNINDYSPIIKIEYGNNSFLFTGDASNDLEDKVLSKNPNLKSDVLKIGHHGSATSTSKSFLNAINPSIAVISVGVGNKYDHPTSKTLDLLNSTNVQIYRTDTYGTILLSSDGTTITKIN